MKDHSPRRHTVVTPTTFGFKEKANSDVTTRQMTAEERARTDLFIPTGRASVSVGNFARRNQNEKDDKQ